MYTELRTNDHLNLEMCLFSFIPLELIWLSENSTFICSGHLILKVETKKLIILQLGKKHYLDEFGNSSQTHKKKRTAAAVLFSL